MYQTNEKKQNAIKNNIKRKIYISGKGLHTQKINFWK